MKKILELIAAFCDKATINAEEKAMLEAAFSEMAAEDQTAELKSAVEEIKAKFAEEAASTEAPAAVDPATVEDKGEPASEAAPETTPAADPAKVEVETEATPAAATVVPEKTIEANEKGEITIQASEYNAMKALASQTAKLVREARARSIDSTVSGLVFSESNKVGIAVPKQKKEIVDFALSLSEAGAERFFSIISKLQTVAAGEVGHSEESEGFAEENAEKVAFFMEKFNFTKDEAIAAVKDAAKSE